MPPPDTDDPAAAGSGPGPDPRPILGLVVNPIAGMGGAVALKGTDDRLEEALSRGAQPVAHDRTVRFLGALGLPVEVLTCSGPMGQAACQEAGVACQVLVEVEAPTTAADTRRAAERLAEAGVDLLCFLGGDGTAMDIAQAIDHELVCLGVPSGVKMNSGVFGETPEAAAEVARAFLSGQAATQEAEVVEVDEAALRRGEIDPVRLDSLIVPQHEEVAPNKAHPGGTVEGLVEAILEQAAPGSTWVLGAGSTVMAIKEALVGTGSLLGIDVVEVGSDGTARLVLEDATAEQLEAVGDQAHLVLSPIGGQGFVVGRGNQQVSPVLLGRLGWERLIVVATPEKLSGLERLRADTGDPALDASAPGHLQVVTGPGFRRMVPLHAGPGGSGRGQP